MWGQQGGKMEPKFKRGQWVECYPGPNQTHAPFVAQVADIDIGWHNVWYHLIEPGDPCPMTLANEDNVRAAESK